MEGTAGVVPAKGPACLHKDETMRLVVERGGPVRAVVWAAP